MAAAMRIRGDYNTYSPVSVDDTGQDRLLHSESRISVTKPRSGLSVWMFSLIIIGLCVLFLFGFCIGFYVRESQSSVKDVLAACGNGRQNEKDVSKLTSIHEDIMYRIRGENIREFMVEFTYEDPVSESLVEKKLEQKVLQSMQNSMLNDFEIEEYDVAVTYADPARPNQLQVLHKDRNTVINFTLENDVHANSSVDRASQSSPHITTDNWKFPFVVHSPSGTVQGCVVYAHYGSEGDLLILQTKRVTLKHRIVLMRLGKVSLAEKVQNVALAGASGVLVYWDPADAEDNAAFPSNLSFIPYASAAVYTTESSHILVPTIPVQTISTNTAAILLQQLQEENDTLSAPSIWSGGLQTAYVIGRRSNDGNLSVRLSTYNVQKRQTVRNIISSIHGTVEKDRYVVIGAHRASLPGVSKDALGSTAVLLHVAEVLTLMHNQKQWKPNRGVKIISWGGSDIGNMGMLQYIKAHQRLLYQRAVAYFDLSELVVGKDVVTARVSPGLHQLLDEVAMVIPDPVHPEFSIQSSWQDYYRPGDQTDTDVGPLRSYPSDRSSTPFLHAIGVTTVSLQYHESQNVSQPSVSSMQSYEEQYLYRFHETIARVMVQVLLSMVDNDIIPYSLTGAAAGLTNTLSRSSELLKTSSKSIQDLDNVLALSQKLQQRAAAFDELIQMYRDRNYLQGFRMVNDIKMLYERLFITQLKGVPYHIMYPTDGDGSMSYVRELCQAGDAVEVWDATEQLTDTLQTVITETIEALRTSN